MTTKADREAAAMALREASGHWGAATAWVERGGETVTGIPERVAAAIATARAEGRAESADLIATLRSECLRMSRDGAEEQRRRRELAAAADALAAQVTERATERGGCPLCAARSGCDHYEDCALAAYREARR